MIYKIAIGTWTLAEEPVKLEEMKCAFMVQVKSH